MNRIRTVDDGGITLYWVDKWNDDENRLEGDFLDCDRLTRPQGTMYCGEVQLELGLRRASRLWDRDLLEIVSSPLDVQSPAACRAELELARQSRGEWNPY